MEMVVVHIFSQSFGHGPIPFVCVHDSGEDKLLTTNDFHGGFVSIGVELFCKDTWWIQLIWTIVSMFLGDLIGEFVGNIL